MVLCRSAAIILLLKEKGEKQVSHTSTGSQHNIKLIKIYDVQNYIHLLVVATMNDIAIQERRIAMTILFNTHSIDLEQDLQIIIIIKLEWLIAETQRIFTYIYKSKTKCINKSFRYSQRIHCHMLDCFPRLPIVQTFHYMPRC